MFPDEDRTGPSARWTTTISSKVNLPHAIDVMAVCRAKVVTLPYTLRENETLQVRRAAGGKSGLASSRSPIQSEFPSTLEALNFPHPLNPRHTASEHKTAQYPKSTQMTSALARGGPVPIRSSHLQHPVEAAFHCWPASFPAINLHRNCPLPKARTPNGVSRF